MKERKKGQASDVLFFRSSFLLLNEESVFLHWFPECTEAFSFVMQNPAFSQSELSLEREGSVTVPAKDRWWSLLCHFSDRCIFVPTAVSLSTM